MMMGRAHYYQVCPTNFQICLSVLFNFLIINFNSMHTDHLYGIIKKLKQEIILCWRNVCNKVCVDIPVDVIHCELNSDVHKRGVVE
jgi:hypothetical protein